MKQLRLFQAFAAFVCCLFVSLATKATITEPVLPNPDFDSRVGQQSCLLYNVSTGRYMDNPADTYVRSCFFFSSDDSHGTGADDNAFMELADSEQGLYRIYSDGNLWSDGADIRFQDSWNEETFFYVHKVEGGITIQRYKNYVNSEFVGVKADDSYQGGLRVVANNASNDNALWRLVSREEAERYECRKVLYTVLKAREDAGQTIPDAMLDIYNNGTTEELRSAADLSQFSFESVTDVPVYLVNSTLSNWSLSGDKRETSWNYFDGDASFKMMTAHDKAFYLRFFSRCDYSNSTSLKVFVDGVEKRSESQNMDSWKEFLLDIPAGQHVVELKYTRPYSYERYHIREIMALEKTPDVTVNLSEAGMLGTEVMSQVSDIRKVQHLVVKGKMNDQDFARIMLMTNLHSVDLSDTDVKVIKNGQFSPDDHNLPLLQEVILPQGLERIEDRAFKNLPLTEITFPNTLQYIGSEAFQNTRIVSANLPESMTGIGDAVFRYNSYLTHVTWPHGLTQLRYEMFGGCTSLDFEIPSWITTIDQYALQYTAVTNVVIPENAYLGHRSFAGCPQLETVTLPTSYNGTTNSEIFCENGALRDLWIQSPTVLEVAKNSNFIGGVDQENLTVHVPSFIMDEYNVDEFWYNYHIVGFDPATIANWNLYSQLHLTEGKRFGAGANLTMSEQAVLRIDGATAQNFGTVKLNRYEGDRGRASTILNGSNNVTVNGTLTEKVRLNGGYWYFLTMPFDFRVGDIENSTNTSYVLRHYNTANRAAGHTGDNWINYAENEIVAAGTGFIVRSYRDTYLTFKARENEAKQQAFRATNIQVPLTVTSGAGELADQGWNLVGNPWLSYFDCSQMDFASPITVWRNWNYVAYSPMDDDYMLAPNQAFFVQSTSIQNELNFQTAGRSVTEQTNTAARRFQPATQRHLLDLTLTSADGLSDRTRVVLNEGASLAYEPTCDAAKMMSLEAKVPQLWTIDAEGNRYAINERPRMEGEVSLSLQLPADGTYTFAATRNSCGSVVLTDMEKGESIDLTQNSYEFQGKAGQTAGRFRLSFSKQDETTDIKTAASVQQGQQETFMLDGRRAEKAEKGIYVVRQNGKAKKVNVK